MAFQLIRHSLIGRRGSVSVSGPIGELPLSSKLIRDGGEKVRTCGSEMPSD